jgi:hypothetical protein
MVSLDSEDSLDEAAQKLSLLHKQSVRKGELEDYWAKTTALCAGSIGKVLFNEGVLRLIRREIRRDTGLLIDSEDLAKSIHDMLSKEAVEQIGPLRIRKRRRTTRKSGKEEGEDTEAPAVASVIEDEDKKPDS